MPLSQRTADFETTVGRGEHSRPELAFVLGLLCVALALVVANAKFTPTLVGSSGVSNDVLVVGP